MKVDEDSGEFSSEDFDENCIAKGSPANLLSGHHAQGWKSRKPDTRQPIEVKAASRGAS